MKKSSFISPVISLFTFFLALVISNALNAQEEIGQGQPSVCPAACGFTLEELDTRLAPESSDPKPFECMGATRAHFVDGFPGTQRHRINVELQDGKDTMRGAQVLFMRPPMPPPQTSAATGFCQVYEKNINDPDTIFEREIGRDGKLTGTTILNQIGGPGFEPGFTHDEAVACAALLKEYARARFSNNETLNCY